MPEQPLLRCPCCDAKARLFVLKSGYNQFVGTARCTGCQLSIQRFVPSNIHDGRNVARQKVIIAWNTRNSKPASDL